MANITNNDNHVSEAQARLTAVFKGKVRIEGIIRALVEPLQEIEDVLQDMLNYRSLLTAFGAQLDIIGEIVGQPRQGRSDEDYLNYIIAKIGQNTSKGTASEVIAIFNLLTGSTVPILTELGNATIEIYADTDISALDSDAIYKFMGYVVSAGVGIGAIYYYDTDDYFGFDDDPYALPFGDITDPSEGGTFAEVF